MEVITGRKQTPKTEMTAEVQLPIDADLARSEISKLVQSVSLNELTSGMIRKHLEEKFGHDFNSHKVALNEMTKKAIEAFQAKKEEKEKEKTNNNISGSKRTRQSSEDSDSDHGVASTQRKKTTAPPKRRKEAAVEKEFDDMASIVKNSRRAAACKAKQDIRKSAGYSSRKGDNKDKDKDKDFSGKFGRMTKLCWISPELQEVVGAPYLKRCDVVKNMWAYIRENNLLDPKDKRFALCDDKLFATLKIKRFRAFSMSKVLKNNVRDIADMSVEVREEAEAEMDRLRAAWKAKQKAKEEIVDDSSDEEEKVKEKSPAPTSAAKKSKADVGEKPMAKAAEKPTAEVVEESKAKADEKPQKEEAEDDEDEEEEEEEYTI